MWTYVNICVFPLPVVCTLPVVCNNKEFNQFIPMGTAFRPCHRRALLERKHHLQYRSRVGVCWYPKLHSSKRPTERGFLSRSDPFLTNFCVCFLILICAFRQLQMLNSYHHFRKKIATLNTYCKNPRNLRLWRNPKTEISQFSKHLAFWPTNPSGWPVRLEPLVQPRLNLGGCFFPPWVFGVIRYLPWKGNMTGWKIPCFNGKYIIHLHSWWIFQPVMWIFEGLDVFNQWFDYQHRQVGVPNGSVTRCQTHHPWQFNWHPIWRCW